MPATDGAAEGQSSLAAGVGANARALSSSCAVEQPPTVAACSSVSVRERYSVSAVDTDLDVIGYGCAQYGRTYNSDAV